MSLLVPLAIGVDGAVKIIGAVGGFIVTVGGFGLAVYKTLPKREPAPTPVQQTAAEVKVIRELLEEARKATEDARKEAEYLRGELHSTRGELAQVRTELEDTRRQLVNLREGNTDAR